MEFLQQCKDLTVTLDMFTDRIINMQNDENNSMIGIIELL